MKNFYLSHRLLQKFPLLARTFRGYRTWILFDVPVVLGAYLLALLARSWTTAAIDLVTGAAFTIFVALAFVGANLLFGVYKRYWSYATAQEALTLFSASALATMLVALMDYFIQPRPLPMSVVFVGGFFALAGQLAIRYRRRLFHGFIWQLRHSLAILLSDGTPTLIVGAGESGQALAFKLQMEARARNYRLVGFLDDDPGKLGHLIHGLPILGTCDELIPVVEETEAELIIVAIHNTEIGRLRHILDMALQTDAQIRYAPDSLAAVDPSAGSTAMREFSIVDLLRRQNAVPPETDIGAALQGRRVLITGAGGSIGAELARQILPHEPEALLLLDINETAVHDLMLGLESAAPDAQRLIPLIADVTRKIEVDQIFDAQRPDVIFHAAAGKHLRWAEKSPLQSIRTNVIGTHNLLEAAGRFGADQVVFLSSLKAVEPAGIIGACERISEMLFLSPEPGRPPKRTVVRFGNVIASQGSVLPTFERQIDQGLPVTITDRRMRRTFAGLEETVTLLLAATALSHDRDHFLLDLGEEVEILDLARKMIRLRGLRPEVDVPLVEIGMQQGEKLIERTLFVEEESSETDAPGLLRIHSTPMPATPIEDELQHLRYAVEIYEQERAISLLWQLAASPVPQRTSKPETLSVPIRATEAPAA